MGKSLPISISVGVNPAIEIGYPLRASHNSLELQLLIWFRP